MRWQSMLVVALVASGCGGDDPPPPPPKKAAAAGAPASKGAGAKDTKGKLQPRMHVEERVACGMPAKATGPKCDPAASTCEVGLYCIAVQAGGTYCEPCPERDSIRHEFKDRDFVADQVRDPFFPFIVPLKGLEAEPDKKIDGPCTRADQFIASNYSYLELKLVGIVAQGTQRKALMTDRINYGHIIRRGDCVGKEKALVKDIGAGFITFVVHPDIEDKTGRPPEERSVQLNPKGLQVAPQQPDPVGAGPSAPILAPPGGSVQPAPPPPSAPVVEPPTD